MYFAALRRVKYDGHCKKLVAYIFFKLRKIMTFDRFLLFEKDRLHNVILSWSSLCLLLRWDVTSLVLFQKAIIISNNNLGLTFGWMLWGVRFVRLTITEVRTWRNSVVFTIPEGIPRTQGRWNMRIMYPFLLELKTWYLSSLFVENEYHGTFLIHIGITPCPLK